MPLACLAPITRGPRRGQPATGTTTGASRHKRAGESCCPACRTAATEAQHQRRAADPGHRRDVDRRLRAADPDRFREAARRRRQAAPEWYRAAGRARMAAWRARNPEVSRQRTRESVRRWKAANRDRANQYERRRHAIKKGAPTIGFGVDELAAKLAYWGWRCWMCGDPADTLDHVKPLAAGGPHCLSNLRPACRSCNSSKGARWPMERTR